MIDRDYEITIGLLEEKFKEFNSLFFGNKIKSIHFILSKSEMYYGRFYPIEWCIEISMAYKRSQIDYMNTLLHEMCHAFIRQIYGIYAQPHGYEWKEVAEMINEKSSYKYCIK